MKVLDPALHTPMTIDGEGTRKFEAFLDRNFLNWRESEQLREKNAGTITREWAVGVDDVERTALYRDGFVEISDQYFGMDEHDEVEVHYLKHVLCDINGDLTPAAVWGERGAGDKPELPPYFHFRPMIERTYVNAVAKGMTDPVIVGFDVRHDYARNFAENLFGAAAVASVMRATRGDDRAMFVAILSPDEAEKRLSQFNGFENVQRFRTQGKVPVVLVLDGQWQWIGMPKPGDDQDDWV